MNIHYLRWRAKVGIFDLFARWAHRLCTHCHHAKRRHDAGVGMCDCECWGFNIDQETS